jgi:hypothetical protein
LYSVHCIANWEHNTKMDSVKYKVHCYKFACDQELVKLALAQINTAHYWAK